MNTLYPKEGRRDTRIGQANQAYQMKPQGRVGESEMNVQMKVERG